MVGARSTRATGELERCENGGGIPTGSSSGNAKNLFLRRGRDRGHGAKVSSLGGRHRPRLGRQTGNRLVSHRFGSWQHGRGTQEFPAASLDAARRTAHGAGRVFDGSTVGMEVSSRDRSGARRICALCAALRVSGGRGTRIVLVLDATPAERAPSAGLQPRLHIGRRTLEGNKAQGGQAIGRRQR